MIVDPLRKWQITLNKPRYLAIMTYIEFTNPTTWQCGRPTNSLPIATKSQNILVDVVCTIVLWRSWILWAIDEHRLKTGRLKKKLIVLADHSMWYPWMAVDWWDVGSIRGCSRPWRRSCSRPSHGMLESQFFPQDTRQLKITCWNICWIGCYTKPMPYQSTSKCKYVGDKFSPTCSLCRCNLHQPSTKSLSSTKFFGTTTQLKHENIES